METKRVRRKRTEDGSTTPKQEAGNIKVYRSYTSSGVLMSEDEGLEELEVSRFEVEPAYVSVNHGRTVNLGNYESAKVDVRVSVPCYREEIEPAIIYADTTAINSLEDIIAEYVEELK